MSRRRSTRSTSIRDLLGVEAVHAIGYCVAGTTLAATLAYLAAKGEADKVASATFFTAQVDFEEAGDLKLFLGDETMAPLEQLTAETGVLDGRYMAATFNLLRGRDLIWSYVVNNYLLGEDPPPFDLLHWNGDVTNLPGGWHRDYLETLYRDNKLVEPGGISVTGVPIDLTHDRDAGLHPGRPRGPYRAAAERVEDHGPFSKGPKRFVLAGSGHIAGVVNPPAAGKYQYWTNDEPRRDARRIRRRRDRAQGQLVARLDRLAEGAGAEDGRRERRAGAGQGKLRRSRTRPAATSGRADPCHRRILRRPLLCKIAYVQALARSTVLLGRASFLAISVDLVKADQKSRRRASGEGCRRRSRTG